MKTTIDMARESNLDVYGLGKNYAQFEYRLEAFAELVRADEREACARVCESLFDMDDDSCSEAEQCATAIRARGNT